MDKTSTLDEFAQFIREENDILKSLGLVDEMSCLGEASLRMEPKKETIDAILNYSKALSVRESKVIGNIEMILN